VATTLLVIDDSVTMRKVLEMTFAGEDFRVVTVDSADAALGKLRAERPAVVLCDVTLDGGGGYGLCAKIKAESPGVAVVVLASKQQPYDGQKGQSARADDYIEKPFDTQQLLDKVKRLLSNRPVVAETAVPSPRVVAPGATTQPGVPAFGSSARLTGTAPMAGGRPAQPAQSGLAANPRPTAPGVGVAGAPAAPQAIGRGTLSYGGPTSAFPGAAGTGRPVAPQASPPASPPAPAPAAAVPTTAAAAATATNGQLAAKLAHLGLTDVQVSAVLALSREVVEKVVWEVVPVLAETMIREEIKRLTSE